MFEGRNLVTFHQTKHLLNSTYNIPFSEYYSMLPYELEAEMSMIKTDIKDEQERLRLKANL